MILPTKGVPPRQALVSLGSDVLRVLAEPMTVSRLWHEFKKESAQAGPVTFDWFVLSLDLLFLVGAIDFDRERVRKRLNDELGVRS